MNNIYPINIKVKIVKYLFLAKSKLFFILRKLIDVLAVGNQAALNPRKKPEIIYNSGKKLPIIPKIDPNVPE
ncbi:hypothetical protein LCIT_06390 [Leuconostoc citreum]|uniref:Uncharacterized protein n=1 Tax=Leuconostoc citreum TaxID=33964 RepID=A0A5A5TXV5_LEUCI|nr:hypothetical protein LCIT_06390 [Leuconostoc citreum]GDZ86575.1 hypothetical protein LCTS_17740 [Leuconostoc citreum]